MGRPRDDTLSQDGLLPVLKKAIDAARIAHPVDGANPAARRSLRRLIDNNADGVRSFKVLYNLGKARRDWFLEYLAHEHGLSLAVLQSPWKDNVRANGPVKGGHSDV